MLRNVAPDVRSPDARAVRLTSRLVLAADDALSLAAVVADDPTPFLLARAFVGALPGGADRRDNGAGRNGG